MAPVRRLHGPQRLSYACHRKTDGTVVRVPVHTYRVTRRVTPPRTLRTSMYEKSELCTAVLVPPGTAGTDISRTRINAVLTNTLVPQIFNRDEYVRLNHEYGPVSLDLYASPYSAVVPQYSTNIDTLLTSPIHGHTVWAELTHCDRTHEILNYLESVRVENPYDVRAIILVPQWDDFSEKPLTDILKNTEKSIHIPLEPTYTLHIVHQQIS